MLLFYILARQHPHFLIVPGHTENLTFQIDKNFFFHDERAEHGGQRIQMLGSPVTFVQLQLSFRITLLRYSWSSDPVLSTTSTDFPPISAVSPNATSTMITSTTTNAPPVSTTSTTSTPPVALSSSTSTNIPPTSSQPPAGSTTSTSKPPPTYNLPLTAKSPFGTPPNTAGASSSPGSAPQLPLVLRLMQSESLPRLRLPPTVPPGLARGLFQKGASTTSLPVGSRSGAKATRSLVRARRRGLIL